MWFIHTFVIFAVEIEEGRPKGRKTFRTIIRELIKKVSKINELDRIWYMIKILWSLLKWRNTVERNACFTYFEEYLIQENFKVS